MASTGFLSASAAYPLANVAVLPPMSTRTSTALRALTRADVHSPLRLRYRKLIFVNFVSRSVLYRVGLASCSGRETTTRCFPEPALVHIRGGCHMPLRPDNQNLHGIPPFRAASTRCLRSSAPS